MNDKKFLSLSICLLMFPQLAQTLSSPALDDISRTFSIPPQVASQAFAVYYIAFALGVVAWGLVCDRIGRRPAMIAGLSICAVGTFAGLLVDSFNAILVIQAVAAFGAAAGSVVTQTMLRDRLTGRSLAAVFSLATVALSASPAIGLCLGSAIVQAYGYAGVMACVSAMAALLVGCTAAALPETRQAGAARAPLAATLRLLVRDRSIWRSAVLVAVFNVAVLSYYEIAPFTFGRLRLSGMLYAASGLLLAFGALFGGWLNKRVDVPARSEASLLAIAAASMCTAGIAIHALRESAWFVAPMLLVVIAFGICIPRILGKALDRHRDRLGTAGACFGLMYYLMIGAGMALVGSFQSLCGALVACGAIVGVLSVGFSRAKVRSPSLN